MEQSRVWPCLILHAHGTANSSCRHSSNTQISHGHRTCTMCLGNPWQYLTCWSGPVWQLQMWIQPPSQRTTIGRRIQKPIGSRRLATPGINCRCHGTCTHGSTSRPWPACPGSCGAGIRLSWRGGDGTQGKTPQRQRRKCTRKDVSQNGSWTSPRTQVGLHRERSPACCRAARSTALSSMRCSAQRRHAQSHVFEHMTCACVC